MDYPYTISYIMRKRMQIDSFEELPKDKRPPRCLHPDTKIFIKNKDNNNIEIINLGQLTSRDFTKILILGPFGWRKINHIEKRTVNEFVSFSAACSDNIICSINHKFPVNYDAKKLYANYHFMMAFELENSNYIRKLLYKPIDEFLEPSLQELNGFALTYELGFLVGTFCAEGGLDYNRCTLSIHKDEIEFMGVLLTILDDYNITTYVRSNGSNSINIRFNSVKLKELITTFTSGKCVDKSLNINLILNCPKLFRQGLFDGYYEGDGSGSLIFSASGKLIEDFGTVCSSLGIITSKYMDKKKFDKRTNKWYTYSILLIRKPIKKSNKAIGYSLVVRNHKISRGCLELIDIEVDDELFLIGDGLIVKNSIWDKPSELDEWFDRVYSNKQTEFDLKIDESEMEGDK